MCIVKANSYSILFNCFNFNYYLLSEESVHHNIVSQHHGVEKYFEKFNQQN